MRKFKVGDRVEEIYLGKGTVKEIVNNIECGDQEFLVLFDERPPNEYNLGDNPCFQSGFDLELIGGKDEL